VKKMLSAGGAKPYLMRTACTACVVARFPA
jgi:hypothetical protein